MFSQFFTRKSSRCLSKANSEAFSIVESFKVIIDDLLPLIKIFSSSSYFVKSQVVSIEPLELLKASDIIENLSSILGFKFIGYVEGDDIPSSKIDVIVTDGFTGNIALKTGEGTATLVRTLFKETFTNSFLAKIASFLAFKSLKNLRKRIDPRRVNGGVFLGLNGTIVKSHGGADAIGICAAITLASKLAKNNFQKNLENKVLQINNFQSF